MCASKICKVCQRELPLSCFTKHPMSADRLQPKCKACRSEYDKSRYDAVREKKIQSARSWNLANPEKVRQAGRKIDAKRKGQNLARWRLRDESVKRATPKWADLSAISMFYEVAAVLSRSGAKFHVDHIVPIKGKSASGLHVQDNLRVIPARENLSKGNKVIAT